MTTLSRAITCRVHTWFPSSPNSIQFKTHSFLGQEAHLPHLCNIGISPVVYNDNSATQSFYLFYSTDWLMLSPPNIHHNPLVGITRSLLNTISDWSSSTFSEDKRQTHWRVMSLIWLLSMIFSEMGHMSSEKPWYACCCNLLKCVVVPLNMRLANPPLVYERFLPRNSYEFKANFSYILDLTY